MRKIIMFLLAISIVFSVASALFAAKGMSNNEKYIRSLYLDIQGREGDAAGIENWTRQLNQEMKRADVVRAFLNSEEYRTRFVTHLYGWVHDRRPDSVGLAFWSEQMKTIYEGKIISDFCSSNEFWVNSNENNKDFTLKELFANQSIESKSVTEVQYFLICDGHIYHYDKAEHLGINVLDYQLCAHTLEECSAIPTKERFKEVINRNQSYAQTSADDLCYHTMKIAGYAFRTPGEKGFGRQDAQDPIDLKSYHPKSSCYCGSGSLYKDCCQLVESIEEKPTDYV